MSLSSVYPNGMQNWHLSGLLDQAAENYGDSPFIVGPSVLTYDEAATQTRQIAAWLQQVGVKRGERVMMITRNRAEIILMAFAVARIGAIFTIINNSIKAYGLKQIIDQVKPAIVMLDETTGSLASEIGEAIIVWLKDGVQQNKGVKFHEIITGREPSQQTFVGIDLDPVCLIYTSGSSGVPRGVVINHDNVRFSTAAIQERLRYRPDDVVGLFLPLSFDYGLYQIFLTMQAGASVFIGHSEYAGFELISKLALYEVSVLPGVPTLFAGMLKLLDRHTQMLPNLRCITNTGEHLPTTYIKKMHQHFPSLQIFSMYGLTECKRVSILLPDELKTKPESVGRPLLGTEAYVVGENGHPLPIGTIGELVVRGRHVARGYWKADHGETAQRFRQGTPSVPYELYTGDLCRMDEEGFIYFIGRKDYQFKYKGFRISPLEVETTACDINGVLEAGLVKSKIHDRLHLFVTVTSQNITTEKVIEELQKRLEWFKVPDKVCIVDQLPTTSHGKLDRVQLSKRLTTTEVR